MWFGDMEAFLNKELFLVKKSGPLFTDIFIRIARADSKHTSAQLIEVQKQSDQLPQRKLRISLKGEIWNFFWKKLYF